MSTNKNGEASHALAHSPKHAKDQDKDTVLPVSFVGTSGRFYVSCPEGWSHNPRYAVRSSVSAYDNRSEIPHYMPAAEALADFAHELRIYAESLTTTPPSYPADRDETDYGLTPAHNKWAERLARVKGERRYAA